MCRPKYLYHTTLKSNKESILQNGLIRRPYIWCGKETKPFCIYCSERPDSWWNTIEYMVFKINISSMKDVKMTSFNMENLDEILIWTDLISPDLISIEKEY